MLEITRRYAYFSFSAIRIRKENKNIRRLVFSVHRNLLQDLMPRVE